MRNASLASLIALALAVTTLPAHALTAAHRLGHEAVPTFESVRLDVDPDQHDYRGSVRIAR